MLVREDGTERLGEPPAVVSLTCPANWGPFKLDLMQEVTKLADIDNAVICTEPEAAAVQYASKTRVLPGEKIAIYDLGGGTFDICFFEKTTYGFKMLGRPDGIEQLGGIDFDEALFRSAINSLHIDVSAIDPNDPDLMASLTQLRRDCVDAKESLSSDVDTTISVVIQGHRSTIRLTRAELEALIQPAVEETVRAARRGLRSAGISADELSAFVLVGGSSRIPLVSEMVGASFRCPVSLDTHPKHDIAMGSARVGAAASSARIARHGQSSGPGLKDRDDTSSDRQAPSGADQTPSKDGEVGQAAGAPEREGASTRRPSRRAITIGAAAFIVLGSAAGVLWMKGSQTPASTPLDSTPAAEYTVDVPADTAWTETDITFTEGQLARFTAIGEISDDATRPNQLFNSDGAARDPKQDVHNADPYLDFRHAALIGRVGESGAPFFVGHGLRLDGTPPGRLYLGVNDSAFTDNGGSFTVQVAIGD